MAPETNQNPPSLSDLSFGILKDGKEEVSDLTLIYKSGLEMSKRNKSAISPIAQENKSQIQQNLYKDLFGKEASTNGTELQFDYNPCGTEIGDDPFGNALFNYKTDPPPPIPEFPWWLYN